MKKISIYMLGALAMTLAACEDGPSEVPVQTNPQGPVYEAGDVITQATGPIANGTLDLANYESSDIAIATVVSVDSLLSDATVSFGFQYSSTADFSNAIDVPVTMTNGIGYVSVDDLITDHVTLFGKSAKAKTVYYRIHVYVTIDGVDYRWGGADNYVANGAYEETIPVTTVIEENYYFFSNSTTWDYTDIRNYPFSHSSADVYDDPVFTIMVTVEEGVNDGWGSWWKIAPESAVVAADWSGLFGTLTNGDTATSGNLYENGESGLFADYGTWKITINMEELTYSMQLYTQPAYLCTPGGYNGWSQLASTWVPYYENKGGYYGAIMASDSFKLTDGNSWDDAKTWGLGDSEGTLSQPGANIPVGNAGLNWIAVNLDTNTYELIPITSVGIVGGFSSANWNIDGYFEMTPNADFSVWTWTGDLEGAEWKIAFNNSWSYNYGGSISDLQFDGGNISGYSGTHTVTLDVTGTYPVITVE